MTFEGWIIFASFWVLFVTTPGPNAANCINNGMIFGFKRSLWGVLGILTQAILFLILSAFGITALLVANPNAFLVAQWVGAAFLIWLGVRGWLNASKPVQADVRAGSIYGKAFMIATINAKSVVGYLAAFSQFVQPDVPIWDQMWVIIPTALAITTLSYTTYTAVGAAFGASALAKIASVMVRRILAVCFVIYGVLLGAYTIPGRA